MTEKNENEINKSDSKAVIVGEIKEYENRIAALKEQLEKEKEGALLKLEELKPNLESDKDEENKFLEEDWYNTIDVPDSKGIVVLSLTDTILIIVCGPYGKGSPAYEFRGQFQRMVIPAGQLHDHIVAHPHFYQNGLFAIMSKDFLKKYDLLKYSNKVLGQEAIEAVINASLPIDDIVTLYNSAPSKQQKMLVNCITTKMVKEPDYYSEYFVSKFTSLTGVNLQAIANDLAEYLSYFNSIKDEK